jgi:hypothetical protein
MGRYSKTSQHLTRIEHVIQMAQNPGPPRPRPVLPRVHKVELRLDPAVIAQIAADYEAGATTPDLMAQYQLGKGTVLRLLRAQGVEIRNQSLTPTELGEAIRLYQSGWSLARVGAHFGRDASLIHISFKRAGVPRRKPWERP